MTSNIEILIIAICVSISCSLVGIFLVLQGMSMIVDAITHTVLFGIVIAFFITKDLNSPFLILGASLTGVLTVYLINLINSTKLIKEDSAIGIVFPFLFSIGVILISKFIDNAHLDVDAVLLGELVFAPFDRVDIFCLSIPKALLTTSIVMVTNSLFIFLFFKEMKLISFDPILASLMGFMPIVLNYVFITLTSITVVSSFESVGAILVISFMIGPPLIAYLFTDKLNYIVILSIFIGFLVSCTGFYVSLIFDVSIAGMISTLMGLFFLFCLFFSPEKGIIINFLRERDYKFQFSQIILLVHLFNHPEKEYRIDNNIYTLIEILHLDKRFLDKLLKSSLNDEYIYFHQGVLKLTEKGISHSKSYFFR